MDTDVICDVVAAGALEFVERMSTLLEDPVGNAGAVRAGLVAWERVRRVADAALVAVVGEVERTVAFRAEGARSPAAFVGQVCGVGAPEAARLCRAGRALFGLPCTARAYGNGEFSADHVDVVARLWTNPRVRPFLPEAEAALVAEAKTVTCRVFRDVAKEWERLVDEGGALALTDRQHADRFVSIHHDFNGSWQLTCGFGAAQGAVVAEILDRYELVELDADWAKARAEHGDNASVDHLARTTVQRRADALWNVFFPRRAHRATPAALSPWSISS